MVRKAKKDYINKLFLINKSHVKERWKILNKIINKKKSKLNKFPEKSRKRFSEKPIVAFTNSTVLNFILDFYMYD